jgi:phosphocarrier protein
VQRQVQVRNRLGMHARAAVKFVQIANRFKSEVKVLKDGQEANGKSIMGLLTLVAAHGVTMDIVCEGDDAVPAADALAALVDSGFGEGVEP